MHNTFGVGSSFSTSYWELDDWFATAYAVLFVPSESFVLQQVDVAVSRIAGSTTIDAAIMQATHDEPDVTIVAWSIMMGNDPSVVPSSLASHPTLNAGEEYWLVLSVENYSGTRAAWYHNDQSLVGSVLYYNSVQHFWVPAGFAGAPVSLPAYRIFAAGGNEIPEPATLGLMALGLGALACVRR
ncbi:MAG: PEP-CTERM sorting domain-containing protein [Bryobacteraceae bacterium]